MGANQSTAANGPTSPTSDGWACCTGRAGKGASAAATSSTGTPETPTNSIAGIPPELLSFKEAAPLPDPVPHNGVITARALSVPSSNLFDNVDDDMLVSQPAYPVTVTLRMRRARPGTDHTNVTPMVRVHIVINDICSSYYHQQQSTTSVVTTTPVVPIVNSVPADHATLPENGNAVNDTMELLSSSESSSSLAAGMNGPTTSEGVDQHENKSTSIHDIIIQQQVVVTVTEVVVDIPVNMPVDLQSERRKLVEAGATLLLSYLTQTWPNQKVLDWVETSFQPLPAPNQTDTKFRVECTLPASPREVVDAMSTWAPSMNRLKWDAAMASLTELEAVDENTRVIVATTKPVNALIKTVESREFIDLSLCRQLTAEERQTIIDSRPSTAEPIPSGEWWISTVCADESLSSRPVTPSCIRATNFPNGAVIYPAANGASRIMLVVHNELNLGLMKSLLRTTMPTQLKTMMTRLRSYLQATVTPLSPMPPSPSVASPLSTTGTGIITSIPTPTAAITTTTPTSNHDNTAIVKI